jgi:hypothetical protein
MVISSAYAIPRTGEVMRTEWSNFSLKARMEFSQQRRENFRVTIIKAYLDHPDEPFRPSDLEISNWCSIPLRSTKRYLKHWKDKGIFDTEPHRYRHPTFGWCNGRTLTVNPVAVMIAREHMKLYGKVL